MSEPVSILLVEDERNHALVLAELLERDGHRVRVATSYVEADGILDRETFDILITDLLLGARRGTDLLKRWKERRPEMIGLVVSGAGRIEDAVEAMQFGAAHFLTKPLDIAEVRRVVGSAANRVKDRRTARPPVEASPDPAPALRTGFHGIIGGSGAMARVFETISHIAPTTATVLITGEPGTGKELVAKAIHDLSPRHHGPFVAINCGALSEGILESELFGHEKGAFTGASKAREGKFEYANKGTLFLDEVGDMPLSLQVKLLRVVQEREIVRLGSNRTIKVDVRLLAATNRDLETAIREGSFREDLYWRLKVVSIALPPLRDRSEDLEPLARHFVRDFSARHGREISGLSKGLLDVLRRHSWPGNVRELQNTLETMVLLARGTELTEADLPPELAAMSAESPSKALVSVDTLSDFTLDQWEKELIKLQLERCAGNRSKAAKALGISERTLYRKLREYGLS